MIRGILFDLDGTLIDSESAFSNCFIDTLNNDFGAKLSLEDYKEYELEQNSRLISYAKKSEMIDDDISNSYIMNIIYNRYEKYFIDIIKKEETKRNFELIRTLKHDYLLGLVTTCRRYYLDMLNKEENIYELFDVIIAREDVKNLKPNSEAYLKALSSLNLSNNEVIAIEDSKRGVDSAINANVRTIKVNSFTKRPYTDNRTIEEENIESAIRRIKAII